MTSIESVEHRTIEQVFSIFVRGTAVILFRIILRFFTWDLLHTLLLQSKDTTSKCHFESRRNLSYKTRGSMKLPSNLAVVSFLPITVWSFHVPQAALRGMHVQPLYGYLDDLSRELRDNRDANPNPEAESFEATKARADQVSNYGVADWKDFVDFEEFDGGDGQMGVAGDGKKGLEKEWKKQATLVTSRTMSAKNAWGKSTGYADKLIEEGVESSRAQQLENWMNQQELLQARKQQRFMTDEFDKPKEDEDWRKLSQFGVERNQVRLLCFG